MEDIVLAGLMLATFVFGYFAINLLGKLMDQSFRGGREAEKPARNAPLLKPEFMKHPGGRFNRIRHPAVDPGRRL